MSTDVVAFSSAAQAVNGPYHKLFDKEAVADTPNICYLSDMDERAVETVSRVLKRDKNIALAYVFGSTVKRTAGPKSGDIDIAVLLKKELRGLDKLKFINKISSAIEAKTKQSVDIVILNHAPVALRQQVVKYGRFLFEKRRGLAHKFIVDTITNYLDYLTILNFFHARAVKRRG